MILGILLVALHIGWEVVQLGGISGTELRPGSAPHEQNYDPEAPPLTEVRPGSAPTNWDRLGSVGIGWDRLGSVGVGWDGLGSTIGWDR